MANKIWCGQIPTSSRSFSSFTLTSKSISFFCDSSLFSWSQGTLIISCIKLPFSKLALVGLMMASLAKKKIIQQKKANNLNE